MNVEERAIRLDEARRAYASIPEYNVAARDRLERRINELEDNGKKTPLQQNEDMRALAERKRIARVNDPTPPKSGERYHCKYCGYGTNSENRVCLPCAVL